MGPLVFTVEWPGSCPPSETGGERWSGFGQISIASELRHLAMPINFLAVREKIQLTPTRLEPGTSGPEIEPLRHARHTKLDHCATELREKRLYRLEQFRHKPAIEISIQPTTEQTGCTWKRAASANRS